MRSLSERQTAVLFALFLVLSFAALAVLTGLAAPGDPGSGIALGGRPTPRPTHPPVTLVGAGDIAECDEGGAAATAALLAEIEGIVFTSGDNAYPDGSAEDYADCYHLTRAERHRRVHTATTSTTPAQRRITCATSALPLPRPLGRPGIRSRPARGSS
jgi:hypothetical protein